MFIDLWEHQKIKIEIFQKIQINIRATCVSQFDQGVLIQSCSAGAKKFTNYVFSHPQFSGVIHNIENYCAILTLIVYAIFY